MIIPDISHWVPVRSWEVVRRECPFMITKATQGTGFIDPTLHSFVQNCEARKIPYWLYFYLNPWSERAQAEYGVKVCKDIVGPMFQGYALDVEEGNGAAGCEEALDYIKTQSEKTMFYTYYGQYFRYADLIARKVIPDKNCAYWEARYGANNGAYSMPCHTNADLHQFTSSGICPGIGNVVDLNRLTGLREMSWFTGEKEEPEPIEGVNEMMGLIINDHKIYFYNIAGKVMYHVPNPAALELVKSEYKKEYGKEIQYLQPVHFNTLKTLIKGKSV